MVGDERRYHGDAHGGVAGLLLPDGVALLDEITACGLQLPTPQVDGKR